LRPHDNDAGHPICLEKLAQFLFHDKPVAARRVTHQDSVAVAHDDPRMKHIEIPARGRKKNQIAALHMRLEPWNCRLRNTFHTSPLCRESGYNIQNAFPADDRDSRHRNRPDYTVAHVVANPQRHVVIPPFPVNAALFVPNLSQPLREIVNVGGAGERHNCFDVRDTVESIEESREHFGGVGRSNQRIWFVGMSKKEAGENVKSATDAKVVLRFR
jgi:hypothetical protein